MALRRLHVDFEALAAAMTHQGSDEYDYYLDTTTGRVMRIATEVWNALEDGRTIAGSLAGWQQEELREAHAVFGDTQNRYLPIPERPVWEAAELMTDFVDSLSDTGLQARLTNATKGRNVLRRFNDILAHYPEEQQRWATIQRARDREYLTGWLQDEGIEVE